MRRRGAMCVMRDRGRHSLAQSWSGSFHGNVKGQSQQKWAYGHNVQEHMTRHDAGLAVRTILQGQLFATRRQSLGSMLAMMQKTEPWVHVRNDAEDIPRSHPRLHTLTYYLTQCVQGVICHDREPERPWSMAAIRATSDGCVWAGSLACKPHFVLQGTGRRRRK